MKKRLSIVLAVLVVTAVFASTALAAPAGKTVSFVSIDYAPGGIVLKFHVSGFTKGDLKNVSFFAASNSQKISCNFVDGDKTEVRCIVSKSLAGKGNFLVYLAGSGFSGELPHKPCGGDDIIWFSYNVSIYDEDGNLTDSESGLVAPAWAWHRASSEGFFEVLAQYGIVFEKTGAFCGSSDLEIPSS